MRKGLGFHNRHSAGGFNPASLFAGGTVQGAWYDPSDLTTLFQDSAGTTPVTAVEQPVGLMLDKSKGLVLGSDTVAGWNLSAAPWSTAGAVSARTATSFTTTGGGGVINSIAVTVGKTYRITISGTTTAGTFYVRNTTNLTNSGSATTGAFTISITAPWVFADLYLQNDSAGVTTITSMVVRELPGNHAYQTTSASRPTLRARYNLLTYTQDFSNAAWVTAASIGRSVTKGTTTGTRPDGTSGTVDTLTFSAVSAGELVFLYQNAGQTLLNVQATESIYVRVASGTATIYLNILDMVAVPSAGNFVAGSAETVTTSWKRIALTGTRTASSGNAAFAIGFDTRAAAGQINAAPFTLEVWGAQLTATSVFPSNTYQRVGAATDYATGAAFPPYLFFDGTDDSMLTNSVNFTGTDKMLVVAGVTKNSDAAVGVIAELSSAAGTLAGAFIMHNTTSAPVGYRYAAGGSGFATDDASTFTAPITNVVTGISNFAGATINDEISMRVNGATPTQAIAGSVSTGNFGNYPLYIGRRNNATLPFNGNIYSLIIAGQSYTAGQISSTESWVAAKTPLGTI